MIINDDSKLLVFKVPLYPVPCTLPYLRTALLRIATD